MIQAGQVVLFRFPQTDLSPGKLRPALVIGSLPGDFNDWLVCMISTQTHQFNEDFDELIADTDADFDTTGLHHASLIRTGRLAVVDANVLVGTLGKVSEERLIRIKTNLANWLTS